MSDATAEPTADPAAEEPTGDPTADRAPADPHRAAAFFDLDKTIIATSSATAFSRPFLAGGLLTRRAMLRAAYAQFLYQVGGADEVQTERMRAQLSRMVTGWDVDQVSAIVERTLHESIDPAVYAEAVVLIDEHHRAGRDVIVVSASGRELVEPIARLLGADGVIATHMRVADGRYTGLIDFYAYGPAKAEAMADLAHLRGYDLQASYAYSDSITDEPMLAAVGHAAVVNPDRALRRLAEERGWETLRFVRPVSLRLMSRRDSRTAAVVLLLLLAAGAVVWVLAGRWRRNGGRGRGLG
ncbi:HAD family hydrolase [Cellulomonas sp. SG140]|uniref:HAD family hydrolase n=1 Tax=Cellulomonas sp. SG140 TaxID=2976536 RepID=UPI0021E8644A|nr:HAD family hydrolase [Cellulomonas sp. SG140]